MGLNLKKQPAWLQLIIFGLLTIGIALISSLIGFHIGLLELGSLKPSDFAKPEYAGITKALLILQFFGIFLIPCLVFAFLADKRPLAFAGIKKPDRMGFIFLGLIIILVSYLMVEWLGLVNQEIVKHLFGKAAQQWIEKGETDVNSTLKNILDMKTGKDVFIAIILVGVMAAIGEELFFRGILQRILIQAFRSPWVGIIVTAAIFSAIHGQFLGFIPRMILGIILGALYWYSGSLIPAMVGHFVFNSLQVLLLYFKVIDPNGHPDGGIAFSVMGILALILVLVLLNYLRKKSLTTYDRVYGADPGEDFTEQ